MPGPWEKYGAPAGVAQVGDPLIAPPDPYKQAAEGRAAQDQARQNAQFDLDRERFSYQQAKDAEDRRRQQEADAIKAREEAEKVEKASDSKVSAIRELRSVVSKINEVDGQARSGWFDTGSPGSIMRNYGPAGTDAYDLAKNISTINAAAAFNALAEMRQNSPTGAALGSVTERELELLQSSVSNLDPNQSEGQFLSNLNEARLRYMDMLRRLDPKAAAEMEQEYAALQKRFEGTPPPIDDENGLEVTVTDDRPSSPGGGNGGGGGGGYLDGLAQGVGSLVEGAASIPAIVVDPLATTLARALGYKDYTSDFASQVRSDLGLPENQNRTADALIKGASSAFGGALAGRGAAMVAGSAPVRNALAAFGSTPIRDAAAGAGAAAGGMLGEQIGGLPGQVAGALAGGVGGYGTANALTKQVQRSARMPNALLSAADDLNVTMLPADVGGPATRMASGAVGRTLGGIPLAEGAERSIQSAGRARDRLAADIGDVTDDAGAGQAARRGFDAFTKSSERRAGELYDRISVAADAKVQLGQTRQALSEVTRGMQSNPELSKLWANHPRLRATLEALTPQDTAPAGREAFIRASDKLVAAQDAYQVARSNVTSAAEQNAARRAVEEARAEVEAAQKMASAPPEGGELSWEDMKRFRSIVGEIIGQPGVAADGSDVAGLRKLYAALSSDMEVTAARSGPKALREFNRANQYWRGRESRINDVFTTLFGKRDQKSDEAVFRQINSWAKSNSGDFSRLARTIRSMPEDEANTVRATIVQRMGQAKAGRQDAAGEVFSPAEFATQWNQLSPRAKTVLFSNKQHRQDLDKLAMVMDGMKRAGEYQNFSNTALGANFAGTGLTALSGPAGMVIAAAYSGASFSLGKLLASPKVARLLASTARMPADRGVQKLAEQLPKIAAREPLIANDLQSLQQYLTDAGRALNQPATLGRAAADDQQQEQRR